MLAADRQEGRRRVAFAEALSTFHPVIEVEVETERVPWLRASTAGELRTFPSAYPHTGDGSIQPVDSDSGGPRRLNAGPARCPGKGPAENRMIDTAPRFRLSIWRNVARHRTLALPGTVAEDPGRILDAESELQEEVYTWTLREDMFGGIADENDRARLQECMDGLVVSLSPDERRIEKLDALCAVAEDILARGGATRIPPSVEDGGSNRKINTLLSLMLHLKWLSRVFGRRPGLSVSIR